MPTRPLRVSISEPLAITPGVSGTNLPLTLISTLPDSTSAATLLLRTGCGVAVGTGVTTGVGVGCAGGEGLSSAVTRLVPIEDTTASCTPSPLKSATATPD